MRSPAQQLLIDKARGGHAITHSEICATIDTEAELEQFRLGLQGRGALTDDARHAIAVRRVEIQRAKGVRGADRP